MKDSMVERKVLTGGKIYAQYVKLAMFIGLTGG